MQAMEDVLALACAAAGDLKTTCAAICVSKSAKFSVLRHCARTLSVAFDTPLMDGPNTSKLQHANQLAVWLCNYGLLVKELKIWPEYTVTPEVGPEITACARRALQTPSLQPGTLVLWDCSSSILADVNPQHLTSLECSKVDFTTAEACSLLTRLTNLRKLDFYQHQDYHDSFSYALAALTGLTALNLGRALVADHEQQQLLALPATLQSLSVPWLTNGGSSSLVNLTSLRRLTLIDPECSREDLIALNSLPQLQQLTLHYCVCELHIAEQQAAVFGALSKLRQLEVIWRDEAYLNAPLAAGIATCTPLTRLVISCCDLSADVDLGTVLQPLQQLQYLGLKTFGEYPNQHGDPLPSLGRMSRHLTNLTHLNICWPMKLRALVEVYAMPQLRELYLASADVGDEGLEVIAHNIGQHLQVLGIGECQCSLDGVMNLVSQVELLPELEKVVVAEWGEWEEAALEHVEEVIMRARPGLVVHVFDADEAMFLEEESKKRDEGKSRWLVQLTDHEYW